MRAGFMRLLQAAGMRAFVGLQERAPLRIRKDPGEVELLGRAGRSADESFTRFVREPFLGRTERDVSRSLAGMPDA